MDGTCRKTLRTVRRAPRRDAGSAAVELAILAPLLFLTTLGAFELGRAVWVKHILSHAAAEAARYASVRSVTSDEPATTSLILARVKSQAVGVKADDLVVQTTWSPSNTVGGTVQVRVSYNFQPVTSLLPFKSLQLASTSINRIAH